MKSRRLERINSLLREVISEVVMRELKDPTLPTLITVSEVQTSNDLHHAKVMISLLEDDPAKNAKVIETLQKASGYIAIQASKRTELRFFPELVFKLDESTKNYLRIDEILKNVDNE